MGWGWVAIVLGVVWIISVEYRIFVNLKTANETLRTANRAFEEVLKATQDSQ